MKIPPPQMNFSNQDELALTLPDQPGCYFWYFRDLESLFLLEMFELLELDRAIQHNDYTLLYVGIAKGQSIKQRILDKHLNSAHVSTLRHSIGSLLAYKDGIPIDLNVTKGKFAISQEKQWEKRISDLLEKNAMIAWITTDTPKRVEDSLLINSDISFPLNIQLNTHPLRPTLKSLRTKYKRC